MSDENSVKDDPKLPKPMGVFPTHQFCSQGLSHMCGMIPFSELKTLRLVCRSWNSIVSKHKRYFSCHVTLKNNWLVTAPGLQNYFITKWQNVTLRYVPLSRNVYFTPYWVSIAPFLKTLNLNGLKVECAMLWKIIDLCILVETIKFTKIQFHVEEIEGDPQPRTLLSFFRPNVPKNVSKVYCTHKDFKEASGGPTIKHITICKTTSFSLCIFDILQKRSAGVLESFYYDNNFMGNSYTKVYPTIEQIETWVLRICQSSRPTLKNFSWVRNVQNGSLIPSLAQHDEIAFTKLTIAMEVEPVKSAFYNIIDLSFLPFLSAQVSLVELNLAVPRSIEITLIGEIITALVNLQKVKLQLDKTNFNLNARPDINIFRNCKNLSELVIRDKSMTIRQGRFEFRRDAINQIRPNYLPNLPPSIRKLTCAHFLQDQHTLQTVFGLRNLQLLTKLEIMDGESIFDDIMQSIIENLILLEELTVQRALVLTDTGLTGLTARACKHAYFCLLDGVAFIESQDMRPGFSIQELTSLRKVDFTHCRRLTDVTLCDGLRLPELTDVTLTGCSVTDRGIERLGVNPKLRILEIKSNPHVTHVGLNRLIGNSKSLYRIITNELKPMRDPSAVNNSNLDKQNCVEHPYFKDIVYIPPLPNPRDRNPYAERYEHRLDIDI